MPLAEGLKAEVVSCKGIKWLAWIYLIETHVASRKVSSPSGASFHKVNVPPTFTNFGTLFGARRVTWERVNLDEPSGWVGFM